MSEKNQTASSYADGGLQVQGEGSIESDTATNHSGIITHRKDGKLEYNDELRTPPYQP